MDTKEQRKFSFMLKEVRDNSWPAFVLV